MQDETVRLVSQNTSPTNYHLSQVSTKLALESMPPAAGHYELIDTVCSGITRMAEHQTEIRALEAAPQGLVQAISDNLPEQFSHFRFTPLLCGSMAEGTKCYLPDEFDFICDIAGSTLAIYGKRLHSVDHRFAQLTNSDGDIEVVKFANSFYAAINSAIYSRVGELAPQNFKSIS